MPTGVRIPPDAPKQNLTAFSKPEGGTREAREYRGAPLIQRVSAALAVGKVGSSLVQ